MSSPSPPSVTPSAEEDDWLAGYHDYFDFDFNAYNPFTPSASSVPRAPPLFVLPRSPAPALARLHDLFLPLAVSATALTALFSAGLYASSFLGGGEGKVLAEGGNSGNAVYDFFMGREVRRGVERW